MMAPTSNRSCFTLLVICCATDREKHVVNELIDLYFPHDTERDIEDEINYPDPIVVEVVKEKKSKKKKSAKWVYILLIDQLDLAKSTVISIPSGSSLYIGANAYPSATKNLLLNSIQARRKQCKNADRASIIHKTPMLAPNQPPNVIINEMPEIMILAVLLEENSVVNDNFKS